MKTLFFLCLLMCFTLGLSPTLAMIEIDNLAIFSTEDINYSFANGYNLTGTLTLTSGRLDIDNYYVFNISATGGDCNISIIQMNPTTLEWNSSCQTGVTRTDNFLGNYSIPQKLYINGTYDSKKTPSSYFVYFAYLNPTNDTFLLNLTTGVQINVIWKNGTAVMDFNFFATNGSSTLSGVNSSPIVYESGFPTGDVNVSVNKLYPYADEGDVMYYNASTNSSLNYNGSGYIEQTLTLYTTSIDIMGSLTPMLIIELFLTLAAIALFLWGYNKNAMIQFLLSTALFFVAAIFSYSLPFQVDATGATILTAGNLVFAGLNLLFGMIATLFTIKTAIYLLSKKPSQPY